MRNTYNISLLRKRIVDALPRPASMLGEAAIEGFLSLPGASAWRPERFGLKEMSFVFDIGVPLALIGDNPTAKSIALEIGDAVRDGRLPDPGVWSVVHAAALLSRWGAAIQLAVDGPMTTAKTWRIEANWPDGPTFDVAMHVPMRGHAVTPVAMPGTAQGRDGRPLLIAADVGGALEDAASSIDTTFAHSPRIAGALFFQPRFWIGTEQKEWLHLARLNPTAQVALATEHLGGADGYRHALRVGLLV